MRPLILRWFLVLLVSGFAPMALAQGQSDSASALRQENASLRSQLEQLRASCPGPGGGSAVAGEQRVGALAFRVLSIRAEGSVHATVVLRIQNRGRVPIILNYQDGSFVLTDEQGRKYALGMDSNDVSDRLPHGISTATNHSMSTTDVLDSGDSRDITLAAGRTHVGGEVPGGNTFNLSATFVSIQTQSDGRMRIDRSFPVAFVGVPRS